MIQNLELKDSYYALPDKIVGDELKLLNIEESLSKDEKQEGEKVQARKRKRNSSVYANKIAERPRDKRNKNL